MGSAVHTAMEMVDWTSPASVQGLARMACAEEGIDALAPEVTGLVEGLLRSEPIQRAAASDRVLREMPYAFEEEGILFRGVVDLLFEEEDGFVIVDYKTDPWPPPEAAQARYNRQAKAYRRAVERISGRPVKEVLFVFAASGQVWKAVD